MHVPLHLFLLLTFARGQLQVQQVSAGQVQVQQVTSGWCSPAIANVRGNVSVNCIGVDPRANEELNRRLQREHKSLIQKIAEADLWAERYHELEKQLASQIGSDKSAAQAQEYLHRGDLDQAAALYDAVIKEHDDPEIRTMAARQYTRGMIEELRLHPSSALPFYSRAYSLEPENLEYGSRYVAVLIEENEFSRAKEFIVDCVSRARNLEKTDPNTAKPILGRLLRFQSLLSFRTFDVESSEQPLNEAADIFRTLAKNEPSRYGYENGETLRAIATFYWILRRHQLSQQLFEEAISVQKQLPSTEPNRLALAETLNNLGNLHMSMNNLDASKKDFNDAIAIYQELEVNKPHSYALQLTHSFINLAAGYIYASDLTTGERYTQKALSTCEYLANSNDSSHRECVAMGAYTMGRLYARRGQVLLAEQQLEMAASNFRELQKQSKDAWTTPMTDVLLGLTSIYTQLGQTAKARQAQEEYCENLLRRARVSSRYFGAEAARALDALWPMDIKANELSRAINALGEAISLYKDLLRYSPRDELTLAVDLEEEALIYHDLKDYGRSEVAAGESIEILRRSEGSTPGMSNADALALSLLAEAGTLQALDPERACGPMEQAEREAVSEVLKDMARTEAAACKEHLRGIAIPRHQ